MLSIMIVQYLVCDCLRLPTSTPPLALNGCHLAAAVPLLEIDKIQLGCDQLSIYFYLFGWLLVETDKNSLICQHINKI